MRSQALHCKRVHSWVCCNKTPRFYSSTTDVTKTACVHFVNCKDKSHFHYLKIIIIHGNLKCM